MASWGRGLGSSGAQPWRRRGCQRPAERPMVKTLPRGLERRPPALGWGAGSFLMGAPSPLPPQRAPVQPGGFRCRARPQETASVAAPGGTGSHSRRGDPQVLSLSSGRLSGLGTVVPLITAPAFLVAPGAVGSLCPPPPPTVQGQVSPATVLTDPCVYWPSPQFAM